MSAVRNETLVHQWTSLEGSIRMSIMFAGVGTARADMYTVCDRMIAGLAVK